VLARVCKFESCSGHIKFKKPSKSMILKVFFGSINRIESVVKDQFALKRKRIDLEQALSVLQTRAFPKKLACGDQCLDVAGDQSLKL
jgi:hypothetical protein